MPCDLRACRRGARGRRRGAVRRRDCARNLEAPAGHPGDVAGATFASVVYVRAYITRRSVLPVLRRVASEIFADNRPAFTPLIVPSVRAEGALVEVELVLELD